MYGERRPRLTLSPELLTVLALRAAFLASTVKADRPLDLNVPPNITLCEPVNLTWTGGTPPYWLNIYGDVGSNKLVAQNTTGVLTTWFVWIPDIPAVALSAMRITVGGSGPAKPDTLISSLLVGDDYGCLDTAMTATSTTSSPTSSSSPTFLTPSLSQPPATSTPINPSSSKDGLSKAAIAGITVAATCVGTGLALVIAARCLRFAFRRRDRMRQPGTQPNNVK